MKLNSFSAGAKALIFFVLCLGKGSALWAESSFSCASALENLAVGEILSSVVRPHFPKSLRLALQKLERTHNAYEQCDITQEEQRRERLKAAHYLVAQEIQGYLSTNGFESEITSCDELSCKVVVKGHTERLPSAFMTLNDFIRFVRSNHYDLIFDTKNFTSPGFRAYLMPGKFVSLGRKELMELQFGGIAAHEGVHLLHDLAVAEDEIEINAAITHNQQPFHRPVDRLAPVADFHNVSGSFIFDSFGGYNAYYRSDEAAAHLTSAKISLGTARQRAVDSDLLADINLFNLDIRKAIAFAIKTKFMTSQILSAIASNEIAFIYTARVTESDGPYAVGTRYTEIITKKALQVRLITSQIFRASSSDFTAYAQNPTESDIAKTLQLLQANSINELEKFKSPIDDAIAEFSALLPPSQLKDLHLSQALLQDNNYLVAESVMNYLSSPREGMALEINNAFAHLGGNEQGRRVLEYCSQIIIDKLKLGSPRNSQILLVLNQPSVQAYLSQHLGITIPASGKFEEVNILENHPQTRVLFHPESLQFDNHEDKEDYLVLLKAGLIRQPEPLSVRSFAEAVEKSQNYRDSVMAILSRARQPIHSANDNRALLHASGEQRGAVASAQKISLQDLWRNLGLEMQFRKAFPSNTLFSRSGHSFLDIYRMLQM